MAEVAMLQDALFVLMQLSLYLQSDSVSVTSVKLHIDIAKEKFMFLKSADGTHATEFLIAFRMIHIFKVLQLYNVLLIMLSSNKQRLSFFRLYMIICSKDFPATIY